MPNEWIADEDQGRHVLVLRSAQMLSLLKRWNGYLWLEGFHSASSAAKYACTEVLIVRAQAIRVRIPTECRGFVANKPSRFCHRRATVILMAKDGIWPQRPFPVQFPWKVKVFKDFFLYLSPLTNRFLCQARFKLPCTERVAVMTSRWLQISQSHPAYFFLAN